MRIGLQGLFKLPFQTGLRSLSGLLRGCTDIESIGPAAKELRTSVAGLKKENKAATQENRKLEKKYDHLQKSFKRWISDHTDHDIAKSYTKAGGNKRISEDKLRETMDAWLAETKDTTKETVTVTGSTSQTAIHNIIWQKVTYWVAVEDLSFTIGVPTY